MQNVRTKLGDGSLGWAEQSPFDAIIVAAAAERLPAAFLDQLSEGGRIIIPIGEPSGGQTMFRFTRRNRELQDESLGMFSFVPLVCDSSPRRPCPVDGTALRRRRLSLHNPANANLLRNKLHELVIAHPTIL